MRSEIFEDYAAIALKQGLISEAEDPRVGSDDLSTIEILYGVKPNGKDEKSMMQQAHPTSTIIAPAYDRLNGLVENEMERHNIIMHILNKPPQGKLTQHRYAEQSLMEELVKIGFYMDNQNQSELVFLADSCTERLQKKAILPLLAAIAGGLTLIGIYNNFAYLSQGVSNDCDNAIEAIEKFSQQMPDTSSQLSELVDGIKYVKSLYGEAMRYATDFQNLNHDNVVSGAVHVNNSSAGQQAFKILERYKKTAMMLSDRIMKVYLPIIQTSEVNEERNSSSIWTGLTNTWYALVGSTKNDVLKMLVGSNVDLLGQGGLVGSLRKSVEQITAKETAMKNYVDQHQESLMEYLSKSTEDGGTTVEPKVEPKVKPKPEIEPPKKKLIDELKDKPSAGMAL